MRRLHSPIALALVLAIAAACPANLRALTSTGTATSAGVKTDDIDEQSQTLIATADFNRDGIADVAKIIQPDGDRSGRSVLEILIGQKEGGL